jgi:hypothetical protein
MIKLIDILNEMRVNEPGVLYIKATSESYTDVDADIIVEFIYSDSEMGGRFSEYNDTLQNVVNELKKDINYLAGGYYGFKDLYRFMKGPISDIFEDTLTKNDALTLVDYYNNNDNQGILKYILDANNSTDYWQSQEELPYIEGDHIIVEPDKEELMSLKEIKDDIEDVLLPFVTLYNQLGTNKFTIAYGYYVGEEYLVERHNDGISYKEPLWDEDYSRTLSEFNNKGFLTVSYKDYKENPEVF